MASPSTTPGTANEMSLALRYSPSPGEGMSALGPRPLQGSSLALQAQPGAYSLAQGAWAMPSPQALNRPSPKRAYGQVQRIAEDQWRCPDGKTFPRAYLAYRHLKELKERNPSLLSPYKSPRTSTAERRALHQRAVGAAGLSVGAGAESLDGFPPSASQRCIVEMHGSRFNADCLPNQNALYAAARLWRSNDPYARQKIPTLEKGNGVELAQPAPIPQRVRHKIIERGRLKQGDAI